MKKPTISIIGRPNVGKSTLINRLAERRVCIVEDVPGVTRDRKYIDINWNGHEMTLVDTGGLVFDDELPTEGAKKTKHESELHDFNEDIFEQANISLNASDAVILVVDVKAGLTKFDQDVANYLRKKEIGNDCAKSLPIFVAVNKVDSSERESLFYEFYELGFERVFPISALHGSRGLSDLLNELTTELSLEQESSPNDDNKEETIRVALVGKPNAGKSSLFNKLIGEDRAIVSEISGTTRDSVDTLIKRHGQPFMLIDTAGLRRKSKVKGDIERHSNLRAVQAIETCDVVVLLIDGSVPEIDNEDIVTDQDKKIISLISDRGKACVVLVNKWDLVDNKDDTKFLKHYKERLDHELHFISYANKEFISALTGKRTDNIWELIKEANEQHKRRIGTGLLNRVVDDILMMHPPPVIKQKALKIKYVTQTNVAPPTFTLFVNDSKLVTDSYKKYLAKQFREYFGFTGTPLLFRFKSQAD